MCLEGMATPSHSWILVVAGERRDVTRMKQSFLIGLAFGHRLSLLRRATPPRGRKEGFWEEFQLVGRGTEALLRPNPVEKICCEKKNSSFLPRGRILGDIRSVPPVRTESMITN